MKIYNKLVRDKIPEIIAGENGKTLFEKASMILVPVKAELRTISWLKEYSLSLGFGSVEGSVCPTARGLRCRASAPFHAGAAAHRQPQRHPASHSGYPERLRSVGGGTGTGRRTGGGFFSGSERNPRAV